MVQLKVQLQAFLQANAFFYEGVASQLAYWQNYAHVPAHMPFLLPHVYVDKNGISAEAYGFVNCLYWLACVYHTFCGGFCDATDRDDLAAAALQANAYLHHLIDHIVTAAYNDADLLVYLQQHLQIEHFQAVYAAVAYQPMQLDIHALINVWDFATHPDVLQYL